jgi:hypothetical protein
MALTCEGVLYHSHIALLASHNGVPKYTCGIRNTTDQKEVPKYINDLFTVLRELAT